MLLSCLFTFASALTAEPTRIYLGNDDHTDYMWTADADTYANVFVEMLDWHLKLADETAANPSPYRNRFNADGALWLSTYEQRKTPAEFARLIARIKDGTIQPIITVAFDAQGRVTGRLAGGSEITIGTYAPKRWYNPTRRSRNQARGELMGL